MTLLPALASVNVDADPNNNRLLFNSQFITGNPDTTYATGNDYSRLTNYGVSGTVTYELTEAMTLKSISAYRELR
jgi:iron complex outermembrane receptor protein